MGLRDEARDPWTYILAGLAGGVAWAVGLPGLAVVGVAAAVGGARTIAGAALGSSGRLAEPVPPPPLPTEGHTPEAAWLERAERAVASFDRLSGSIPDQILSERTRSMGEQSKETLAGLRRLSGQASTTRGMSAELNEQRLRDEATHLEHRRDRETDLDVRAELSRSLESVKEQRDIARRLDQSLAQIVARVESGALGLERLVAQLAEILALSDAGATTTGADQLEELADELEGLRAGLSETERLSRRALSGSGLGGSVADEPGPRPDKPEGMN
jgi:hypothetical protein